MIIDGNIRHLSSVIIN